MKKKNYVTSLHVNLIDSFETKDTSLKINQKPLSWLYLLDSSDCRAILYNTN